MFDNNKNCYYCDYCYSCDYCHYCYYCYSCDSCAYCYSCKGLRMSENMIFCLGDGKWERIGEGYQKNNRIFNKQVSTEELNRVRNLLSDVKITFTKWVNEKDLSDDEKTPIIKQTGGLLKRFTYEDAWKNWWNEASKQQKDLILTLPQFDAEIFKSITGIDVTAEDDALTHARKLLEENGYKIVKE